MNHPPLDLPAILALLGRSGDPRALAHRSREALENLYPTDADRKRLQRDLGLVVLALLEADWRLSEIATALGWAGRHRAVLLVRAGHAQSQVHQARTRVGAGTATLDDKQLEGLADRLAARVASPVEGVRVIVSACNFLDSPA